MYPVSFDSFLAAISARTPSEKAKACFDEARSLSASAMEFSGRAEEISRRARAAGTLAHQLEHQALFFHAEVVGACKHLYSRDSKIMCGLPIGHEDEMHEVPDIGWVNPPERIRRRCWDWPCLRRERIFDRFEATRDDGAKFWCYRDSKGHVDSFV